MRARLYPRTTRLRVDYIIIIAYIYIYREEVRALFLSLAYKLGSRGAYVKTASLLLLHIDVCAHASLQESGMLYLFL